MGLDTEDRDNRNKIENIKTLKNLLKGMLTGFRRGSVQKEDISW
jgi:hypothetical protein